MFQKSSGKTPPQKILVTEFVKGQKLEDWEGSEDAKCDLAKKLALAFIDQVVEAGIFHADPHPANIIVTETGIYLIDFGMVGFLDQDMRDFVTKIFFVHREQRLRRYCGKL